jgi:hypothetical protein
VDALIQRPQATFQSWNIQQSGYELGMEAAIAHPSTEQQISLQDMFRKMNKTTF